MCLLGRYSTHCVPGYRHVFAARIVKTLCARLQACVCWEDTQHIVCQATGMCLLGR